jgi:hypothetical protein
LLAGQPTVQLACHLRKTSAAFASIPGGPRNTFEFRGFIGVVIRPVTPLPRIHPGHESVHLLEQSHNQRFQAYMQQVHARLETPVARNSTGCL